jgi:hypothetical protein
MHPDPTHPSPDGMTAAPPAPTTPAPAPQPAAAPARTAPPITGVTPPALGEALIRECRPTVLAGGGGVPALARKLMRSIVLAPLGWLLLLPAFLKKITPGICRRYTLTNRRLMIQRGMRPDPARPVEAVALADIDEVRLEQGSYDPFYFSGTLEVLSGGQVKMRLPGVPEPEGFRQAVINACVVWGGEGRAKKFLGWQPAAPAK